ncbi:HSP20-like chaperone [Neocallimastix sp. 'constans']
MSFYLFDQPMDDSDDFFSPLFYTPFGYYTHPKNAQKSNKKSNGNAQKKQSSHPYDKDVYKLVDFSPKFDLGEDEKNYYIQMDLPGMTKEQIQMELTEDNSLTISGERVKSTNEIKFTKMNCQYGKFSRSFSLPENANVEKIEAKMANGVLEIIIPKAEPPKNQRRTIQIQ